jgi:hypothetical protein
MQSMSRHSTIVTIPESCHVDFENTRTFSVIGIDAISVDERCGALCWVAQRDVKLETERSGY